MPSTRSAARFVGRRGDLDVLAKALASAVRRHGQVVGIVREAGIGKSRLLFEFRQSLAGEPLWYVEGSRVSYRSAIPYLPVVDIVRQSCGIAEPDNPETATEKVPNCREILEDPRVSQENVLGRFREWAPPSRSQRRCR
jgi:predicted ATPase